MEDLKLEQEQNLESPEAMQQMEELKSKAAELESILKDNPNAIEKLDGATKEKVKTALKGILLGLAGVGLITIGSAGLWEAVKFLPSLEVENARSAANMFKDSATMAKVWSTFGTTAALFAALAATVTSVTGPFILLEEKLFPTKNNSKTA